MALVNWNIVFRAKSFRPNAEGRHVPLLASHYGTITLTVSGERNENELNRKTSQ